MAASDAPKMQYRNLGRSGLKVSCISLGGWVTYGGHVGDEKAFECMKAAYDHGINFFDCAEAYAKGESEIIMGKALKHFGWKRNDIVISTKIYWGSAFGTNPINNTGLSRKHLIEGTDAALKRLDLDYVDLIYAHRPDRETPMEEVVRGFNHLINTGKAFYWGTSEWNPEEISEAWRWADKLNLIGPVMEQPQYNMLERKRVEGDYLRLYAEHGMGLTPWSPLKYGILSGKYNDGVPEDSRYGSNYSGFSKDKFAGEETQKFIATTRKLKPIADKVGCTQAQLAYAWILKNPHVSSAITGASRKEQVVEAVGSLKFVEKLTPEIMEEIDGVLENKPKPLTSRF